MTSQHFAQPDSMADGWEDWGDWEQDSNSNNNNNNMGKQQQPIPQSTPMYSPFAYQQQPQAPSNAFAAPQNNFNQQNFFSDTANNNSNVFDNAQSAAATKNVPPPMSTGAQTQNPYSNTRNQFQKKSPFMPQPSTSPLSLPPPQQQAEDVYSSNQLKHLPAPPAPVPNYQDQIQRQTPEQPVTNNFQGFQGSQDAFAKIGQNQTRYSGFDQPGSIVAQKPIMSSFQQGSFDYSPAAASSGQQGYQTARFTPDSNQKQASGDLSYGQMPGMNFQAPQGGQNFQQQQIGEPRGSTPGLGQGPAAGATQSGNYQGQAPVGLHPGSSPVPLHSQAPPSVTYQNSAPPAVAHQSPAGFNPTPPGILQNSVSAGVHQNSTPPAPQQSPAPPAVSLTGFNPTYTGTHQNPVSAPQQSQSQAPPAINQNSAPTEPPIPTYSADQLQQWNQPLQQGWNLQPAVQSEPPLENNFAPTPQKVSDNQAAAYNPPALETNDGFGAGGFHSGSFQQMSSFQPTWTGNADITNSFVNENVQQNLEGGTYSQQNAFNAPPEPSPTFNHQHADFPPRSSQNFVGQSPPKDPSSEPQVPPETTQTSVATVEQRPAEVNPPPAAAIHNAFDNSGATFDQDQHQVHNRNIPASSTPNTFPPMPPTQPRQENFENIQEQPPAPPRDPTEHFYPENRERLDDLVTPPAPTPSSPFTDRHNYLVTGQLSQDRPPPGLSRMVVGQPETTRDQIAGLNRMVTGTETAPNYMNYQRHADGEVAQPPSRPPVAHTGDRNLYLVAGESDVTSQRVIPGVESDNSSPTALSNQVQNLHIDDDSFVHVQDEPREEDIDGGNDNSEVPLPLSFPPEPEMEAKETREEAIEGANDEIQEKPRVEVGLSSEDSELRAIESKPKPRRSKKYTDDTNSGNEEDDKQRRKDKERYRKDRKSNRHADDTDGSKYGRRSDDEEDYRRKRDKPKRHSRNRNPDDSLEMNEKERGKREKRRSDDSRRKDYGYDDERRERRRRERDRDRYYDNESYSGRRSQNASDREYSDRYTSRAPRDDKDRYYQQQGFPRYDYDSYYQQQQYFETLRRTNPQAYYEWYTKYYAGMMQQQQQMHSTQVQPTMDDLGGSLRSGYSSSNEKERTANMSHFLPGGNISNPLRSMNSSFIDSTDYNSLQGGVGFTNAVKDLNQAYSLNYGGSYGTEAAARLTPKKFQSLHSFVSLTNGFMTSSVDSSVKIAHPPISDKTKRLYQAYPGPLIRNVSHKKTVIEFCEDQLRGVENFSASLLWKFLIMMIRQNGNYTVSDVSELLMQNSVEYRDQNDLKQEAKPALNEEIDDVEDISEASTSQDVTASASSTSGFVLHKFRDYLLYGNINDALDFATENNLWGHALFLASKVDSRQHANVMLKFANKLPYNDPLQTLYQIMSGRLPACVTCLDEKWGDWRPHLSMIVSNCSDKPELVKRAILALGDSLNARGDLYGAHFCYLLAEPEFGNYSDEGQHKLVLLGSSHLKPFKEFASDSAIIMTEIYEYARSLSEENFFISSLQKYKMLLCGKIADCGLQLKSLCYLEQIASCIVRRPNDFEFDFISRVYELSDRLKFYDPVMEKSYEDNFNNNEGVGVEDPKWLTELANLLRYPGEYQEQSPQHISAPISSHEISQHQSPVHQPYYEDQNVEQQQYQQQQYDMYNQQPQQPEANSYSYEYSNPVPTVDTQDLGVQGQGEQIYQQEQPAAYQPQQNQQQQPSYGYGGWDNGLYQTQAAPKITMGNMVSNELDENPSSTSRKPSHASESEQQKTPAKKAEPAKQKKAEQASGQSSGWFGGIFSKLSKKSNQMILPDDKNPTIVWDEAAKKWVNKDGDTTAEEAFKPPPKMGGMMMNQNQAPAPAPQMPQMPQFMQPQPTEENQSQQQQQQQPMMQMPMAQPGQQMEPMAQSSPIAEQPPGPAAPNMFKMQKGRNLKKSYVDILGSTGQTVAPKELSPQDGMQLFNPVQQPQTMQFYNPNDFH